MGTSTEWTSEQLIAVRDELVANRSVPNAIAILERLLPANAEELDADSWQSVKDLINVVFGTIPVELMLDSHQIILLQAVNNAPDRVVDWLAQNYLLPAIDSVEQRLKTSAKAVTIALSRRVRSAACAESLAKLLWRFADVPEIQTELLSQIKGEQNSEKRFRVHDVTKLALMQPTFRERHVELNELIDAMLQEMDVDDLLVRMSALDLLADIAASHPANAQHFHSKGQLDKIYKLLANAEHDPDGGILYTGCVRFFGYLSAADPNCLRTYPAFTKSVLDMVNHFDCLDPARRMLAFETLAVVASTSEAKAFLNESSDANPQGMKKAMNHFGAAIASGPMELRTRHVDALNTLMSSAKSTRDAQMLEEWFGELGAPFPKLLLDYLQKPFEDLRLATYHLLISLFAHEWAVLRFFSLPGFSDFLITRGNDPSAQGTQLKYDVICRVLETKTDRLDPVERKQLEQYRAQGAFYAEKPPQLAMEST